jgi:four helix bundle protein
MAHALTCGMAGVRRYQDFAAWQLAEGFKQEVFRLVRASPDALRDFRFRDQLRNAAGGISKHITEGYLRFSPLDFARFLDYALGSLGEAERRLGDGVELGYFAEVDCREAFRYARRSTVAIGRLKASQIRYAEGLRKRDRGRRKPENTPPRNNNRHRDHPESPRSDGSTNDERSEKR